MAAGAWASHERVVRGDGPGARPGGGLLQGDPRSSSFPRREQPGGELVGAAAAHLTTRAPASEHLIMAVSSRRSPQPFQGFVLALGLAAVGWIVAGIHAGRWWCE